LIDLHIQRSYKDTDKKCHSERHKTVSLRMDAVRVAQLKLASG
jgi:hypothetical protein